MLSSLRLFYAAPSPQGHSGDFDAIGQDGGTSLGPREFKALEGLTPVEARLLVTSLVEDATGSGIGEMLRKEEASKQVHCCTCRLWAVFFFSRLQAMPVRRATRSTLRWYYSSGRPVAV